MSGVRGRFLTLEGIDGAGKSTHVAWIAAELRRRGHAVVETREPGGTALGEALRVTLLRESMSAASEALLMFAARAEHLARIIRPALAAGQWVLCDRFSDASFAYQGGGRGVPQEWLAMLESWVQDGLQPDLTLLFDIDPETARARRAGAREADKFEREDEAFFARVRAAYLARAEQSQGRITRIDGARTIEEIRADLAHALEKLDQTVPD